MRRRNGFESTVKAKRAEARQFIFRCIIISILSSWVFHGLRPLPMVWCIGWLADRQGSRFAMLGPKLVLIVEDDRLIRVLSADLLIEAGVEIVEAADGEEAFELLEHRASQIAAVFTDVRMPGTRNGLDLGAACGRPVAVDFDPGHLGQFQRSPAGPAGASTVPAQALETPGDARFRPMGDEFRRALSLRTGAALPPSADTGHRRIAAPAAARFRILNKAGVLARHRGGTGNVRRALLADDRP